MSQKKSVVTLCVLLLCLYSVQVCSQRRADENPPIAPTDAPRLVVGIVVDQMRYDYLTRFWNHFGDEGFKRLVGDGFLARNNHFNYVPTYTAPGHASIYTGTTPSGHGIIGNNWFDKENGKEIYCVTDTTMTSVGTVTTAGQVSPFRLESSTLTDQLRLHTQMRGKVVAIAIKDRASVLPGGHMANAAYWFQGGSEGHWISSSYYMDKLPAWVTDYNASGKVNQYRRPWDTADKIDTYLESGPDDSPFEGTFNGKDKPTFPYDLPLLWDSNGQYDLLKETPYGNSLTTDFALLALDKEALGKDDITDFLAISYSSTDYIGHRFGVSSKEVEDAYVRLDGELARLLKALDKQVGEGQYTLFLTADHGAMRPSGELKQKKISSGDEEALVRRNEFRDFVAYTYGTYDIIQNISNHQIFLNHRLLENLDLSPREVEDKIATELIKYEGIGRVYTAYQMQGEQYNRGIPYLLQNGFNQKRSGDILWVPSPGFSDYGATGSQHGSPYQYDTHVPLIFYGRGIRTGSTLLRTEIPDIAPTVSVLLGMEFPNAATGEPIAEALK